MNTTLHGGVKVELCLQLGLFTSHLSSLAGTEHLTASYLGLLHQNHFVSLFETSTDLFCALSGVRNAHGKRRCWPTGGLLL